VEVRDSGTGDLTLEQQVIAALRRIVRAIDLHSRYLMDHFGLTGPQLLALQEAARLGPVPVGALARDVHVSHPTMSGIVDRLERRGLIARVRDRRDRRRISVTVTDEGQTVLDQAPSPLQERFRRELGKLQQWEQTMILSSLQRMATMMDAEELAASPVLTTGTGVAQPGPAPDVPPRGGALADGTDRDAPGTAGSTANGVGDADRTSHPGPSEQNQPAS
jgi:DNA-binding MarR family transcriptional regulator